MKVTAVRVYDVETIEAIMKRPDIWATIAEDGFDIKDYHPDPVNECWLLMVSDTNDIVGVYRYHSLNAVTVKIHANVLPEHRTQYSKDSGTAALDWLYNNAKGYNKVVAEIPVIYDNVKKFTCSFGFKVEGINRMSYLKNGAIVDQWYLGITREEIGALLDE